MTFVKPFCYLQQIQLIWLIIEHYSLLLIIITVTCWATHTNFFISAAAKEGNLLRILRCWKNKTDCVQLNYLWWWELWVRSMSLAMNWKTIKKRIVKVHALRSIEREKKTFSSLQLHILVRQQSERFHSLNTRSSQKLVVFDSRAIKSSVRSE